jgi:hypothetical protein
MRKLVPMFILGILLMSASHASAFTLSGGYTGDLEFKFSDFSTGTLYESSSEGYGEADGQQDSYGIFKITTIKTPSTQTLWFDGKDGEELTGIYYNLDDDFWTVDGNGNLNIQSVNGIIDVYLDSSPDFDPTQGPGAVSGSTYPTVTDGTLFLRLAMVPGIKYGDANASNDYISYDVNLDGTTSPFTGDGAFYLDVIGGSYASLFDTNSFCLTDDSGNVQCRDLFGQFDTESPGSFGWLVNSEDPISGRTGVVPEPASMALLASGFMGMVGARLRKKA